MRHEPIAEDRDRALAVAVEVHEPAALGTLARRGMDVTPLPSSRSPRAPPELVGRQRGEELAAAASLASCTAATAPPPPASAQTPGRARSPRRAGMRHAGELDPLDVADDRDTGCARCPSCPQRRRGELAHPGLEVLRGA